MKKRILSTLSVFIMICIVFSMAIIPTQAADVNQQIDGSYLTNKDSAKASIYSEAVTRGTHLMDGECSITKAGKGHIYVYASTTANHDVDYISTVIYVDQYNEETEHWGQIAYWQVEDSNTYYVSTSKMLPVDKGYFYRVHADHAVRKNGEYEEATTATDGILIN